MKTKRAGRKKHPLWDKRYPLSNKYDPAWVIDNQMGPNALWLTEWLARGMSLKPKMRVLDLGCGKAMSSIFLAREFGVRVFAVDLWVGATENWERIQSAGVADSVFPLHIEAHALPFAQGFFDAIISVDAYHYFGTDDMYLNYLTPFLRKGGQIGIAVPALMRNIGSRVPRHFTRDRDNGAHFWQPAECYSIRTCDWWLQHWRQTDLLDVQRADTLKDGWRDWLRFMEAIEANGPGWPEETQTLREDQGRYLGFARIIGRKK